MHGPLVRPVFVGEVPLDLGDLGVGGGVPEARRRRNHAANAWNRRRFT